MTINTEFTFEEKKAAVATNPTLGVAKSIEMH